MPPASAIFSAAERPIPDDAPVTMHDPPAHGLLERDRAEDPPHEPQELVGDLLLDDLGDAADGPGPAPHGSDQRAVAEQVGVEVALPVVPELVGVGLERRHPDVGAARAPPGPAGCRSWSGS